MRPILGRAAVLAESASTPAIGFLLTPLIVGFLGVESLGHFIVAQAIVVAVAVGTAGSASAIVNAVASTEGGSTSADRVAAGRLLAALWCLGIILVFCGTGVPQWGEHLGVAPARVIGAAGVWGGLQAFAPVLLAPLKGQQKFIEAAGIELFSRLLVYGTFLFALLSRWQSELSGLLQVVVFGEVLALVFRACCVHVLCGASQAFFALPTRTGLGWTWRFSSGVLLQGVSGLAFNSADKFLVGLLAGPTMLAAYGATVQVVSLVHFVPAALAAIHIPRLVAARDNPRRWTSGVWALRKENLLLTSGMLFVVLFSLVLLGYVDSWPKLPVPEHLSLYGLILIAYISLAAATAEHALLTASARTRTAGNVALLAAIGAGSVLAAGLMLESLNLVAGGRLAFALSTLLGWRRAVPLE